MGLREGSSGLPRVVATVLSVTLGRPPRGETHWSSRAVAEKVGVSPSTVLRIWCDHGVQPHRTRTFKYSTDPELSAKVVDVIGLYLHPPSRCCPCDRGNQSGALAWVRTPDEV